MANKRMKYKKGQRGLEYSYSLAKATCPKCGEIGYIQSWYSWLGSNCYSAAHVRKLHHKTKLHPTGWKTYRRCWF